MSTNGKTIIEAVAVLDNLYHCDVTNGSFECFCCRLVDKVQINQGKENQTRVLRPRNILPIENDLRY